MLNRLVVVVALAAAALFPGRTLAQDVHHRGLRLGANLALGFAGELDSYIGSGRGQIHTEADLEPSVGFELRAELPVLDFFAVGGRFTFMSFELERSGADREETFSFDAFLRVRWALWIARSLYLEPYVFVPFGLTLAVLPDSDGRGDAVWPGWNTALLVGAQILHGSGLGGYFEIGWRHGEVHHSERVPLIGTVDQALVVNEMALNLGFVYVLGG